MTSAPIRREVLPADRRRTVLDFLPAWVLPFWAACWIVGLAACNPPDAPSDKQIRGFVYSPPSSPLSGGSSGKLVRWTGATTVGVGTISDDGANHLTVANTSGYAYTATPSGTDADNRGYQCSSTWSGASGVGYCFHGLMAANSAVTAYAAKLGCTNSGGGACRALEASDGDVFLNTQSGVFQVNGTATFASGQVNFGKGGSNNSKVYEKHNTSPSLGANCTSGTGSSITGSDWLMGVTLGTTSTACTITFTSSPANFTSPPDCMVFAMTGTNQAGIVVGTITTTSLPITGLANSAKYVIQCVGH